MARLPRSVTDPPEFESGILELVAKFPQADPRYLASVLEFQAERIWRAREAQEEEAEARRQAEFHYDSDLEAE